MPVMDEFKEERSAVKNGTPKQKLTYFFDYYKWYVVGGIIAVIIIGSIIRNIVTYKDTAFYAMLVNAVSLNFPEDADDAEAFAAYAGIDTKEYKVFYDTSAQIGIDAGSDYQALQQIMVHITAADLDVMVSDTDCLMRYAYLGDFHDLRDLLSPEQLERYGDSFFYIDRAVLDEVEAARNDFNQDYTPVYGDPRRPGDMRDPVPVGVFLESGSPLLQDYTFREESPAACILVNTKHPETSVRFIDFLMSPAEAPSGVD